MSEQPAEHLARLKRLFPLRSIRHVTEGFGFQADRPGRDPVWAGTLPELETRLQRADAAPQGRRRA